MEKIVITVKPDVCVSLAQCVLRPFIHEGQLSLVQECDP